MDCHDGDERGLGNLAAPRRNNYFYGKLMDELHFRMEQTYGNHKRWLLNRLSLGAGVLCGLEVWPDGKQVCVKPGVAIDGLGREIVVPVHTCLDPWKLTNECGEVKGDPLPTNQEHQVYICLAYAECATEFMPVLVVECNTREQCAPGTTVETFHLLVLKGTPDPLPESVNDDLCRALIGTRGAPNLAVT